MDTAHRVTCVMKRFMGVKLKGMMSCRGLGEAVNCDGEASVFIYSGLDRLVLLLCT